MAARIQKKENKQLKNDKGIKEVKCKSARLKHRRNNSSEGIIAQARITEEGCERMFVLWKDK